MNKVLGSLVVFAFMGLVISSGVSTLGAALNVFADNTQKHSLLSYDHRI